MRIMATFLLQAPVVEPGEGISASQVETLLTGDEPGIMWAAWWGRMEGRMDAGGRLWLQERGRKGWRLTQEVAG